MPFIEKGDQARDVELNLLWRGSTTHRNRVITHPILLKQPPQRLHKRHKIGPIRRAYHIARIPIIHPVGGKILPVNADALERGPGLEQSDDALRQGLATAGRGDGEGKVLGPGPAADCESEVEGAVELGVELCELAKEAEVLGRGGGCVLGGDAVADKRVLEVGPPALLVWSVSIKSVK